MTDPFAVRGKLWLAEMLVKTSMTTSGAISFESGNVAGICLVFKTKKAARKHFGKNVALTELTRREDGQKL